jgi:NADH-quinone oxidoreductase subunit E
VTEETLDFAPLDELLDRVSAQDSGLIPVLQQTQEIYGYLPKQVLARIAKRLSLPPSQVLGVATFYAQFHLHPRGRHIIQQCDGTACHVRGAKQIITAVEDKLGIRAGQTTPDMKSTYEVVYCLGSCALAPVAVVDGNVVGRLASVSMLKIVNGLT